MPHLTATRQATTHFILNIVMLDGLSFVDREAHWSHEGCDLFVQLLASLIGQGVRSNVLVHRHR
jgi:hypothetical protein